VVVGGGERWLSGQMKKNNGFCLFSLTIFSFIAILRLLKDDLFCLGLSVMASHKSDIFFLHGESMREKEGLKGDIIAIIFC
jgi:hypothetical protein